MRPTAKEGMTTLPPRSNVRCSTSARARGVVEAHLFVEAVAVGGLDDKHIGAFHALRVAQKGLVRIAHVAAEDHLALRVALAQPQFDGRGAEQVADVRKADLHAFEHGQALAIAAGAQKRESALGVLKVVDRLHGRSAGALGLARFPLRVRDLYVGAVAQHDLQKVTGLLRGVNRAAGSRACRAAAGCRNGRCERA